MVARCDYWMTRCASAGDGDAEALAQTALAEAEAEHAKRSGFLARERDSLEKRENAEEARWEDVKARLTNALRKAKN